MPASNRRKPRTFEFDGFTITLVRISDREYVKLWRRSIAIAEDGLFLMLLEREADREGEYLDFARIHFILQRLFGKSGCCIDDWKGSFSFPFLLEIRRTDRSYAYTLDIHNHRTMLEFAIRRIVDPSLVDPVIRQPVPEEFSRAEINKFIAHLYGYLGGYLEVVLERKPRIRPFAYRIQSNFILYGYRKGTFFEHHFDNEAAFITACKAINPGRV